MANIPPGNSFLAPSPVTPPFLIITAITNTYPAIITVSTSNNYVAGQLIHLNVPSSYGMVQADQLTGEILAVDVTNLIFTTSINATQFSTFAVPSSTKQQPASIACAGSKNIYNSSTVPFHSVGNTGN